MPVSTERSHPLPPKATVIAASTGALPVSDALPKGMGDRLSHACVFIALHMPEGFDDYACEYFLLDDRSAA